VSPKDPRTIYVIKGGTVFATADEGLKWDPVGLPTRFNATPKSVQVSAGNTKDLWVTLAGSEATSKVWRSPDGGRTWVNETGTGLPNLTGNTLLLDEVQGTVYVGMDVGVYFRKIGEKTWQPFMGGLPNVAVRELRMARKGNDPQDRRLLAATYGRGVWRTPLWEERMTRVRTAPPILRGFSASMRGGSLHLSFGTGADRLPGGEHAFELRGADGTLLYRESIPGLGAVERDIPLNRLGRGIGLFILKGPEGRVTRPVALF
jgi:hypothetical protein